MIPHRYVKNAKSAENAIPLTVWLTGNASDAAKSAYRAVINHTRARNSTTATIAKYRLKMT